MKRALLAIAWQDDRGRTVTTDMGRVEVEMPALGGATPDGWTEVSDVYRIPKRATRASIDLRLRWASNATLRWTDVRFEPAPAPPKRLVRLGAAHLRPEDGQTTADNLRMIEPLVAEAAAKKADLLVLGELVTVQGIRGPAPEPEMVPGPVTQKLGEMARRHNGVLARARTLDNRVFLATSTYMEPWHKWLGDFHNHVPRERPL